MLRFAFRSSGLAPGCGSFLGVWSDVKSYLAAHVLLGTLQGQSNVVIVGTVPLLE